MIDKKVYLLIAALLAIVIYFATPYYHGWLMVRIFNPHLSIAYQAQHLDVETRKELRFGAIYVNYRKLVGIIENAHVRDPLILLPPNDYLHSVNVGDFESVEPAEFYYLTGMRSVYPNSPGVEAANLSLTFNGKDNKLVVKRIRNMDDLNRLLTLYKPYLSNL
jgi:hypothetical protein